MSSLFLVRENFSVLSEALASGKWVIACLCAGWCDVCKQYRAGFDALAPQYPEHQFVWIDIEDQSDLIGDLIQSDPIRSAKTRSGSFQVVLGGRFPVR